VKRKWPPYVFEVILFIAFALAIVVHLSATRVVNSYFELHPLAVRDHWKWPVVCEIYALMIAAKGFEPANWVVAPILSQVLMYYVWLFLNVEPMPAEDGDRRIFKREYLAFVAMIITHIVGLWIILVHSWTTIAVAERYDLHPLVALLLWFMPPVPDIWNLVLVVQGHEPAKWLLIPILSQVILWPAVLVLDKKLTDYAFGE
jgi:hypothetical protein